MAHPVKVVHPPDRLIQARLEVDTPVGVKGQVKVEDIPVGFKLEDILVAARDRFKLVGTQAEVRGHFPPLVIQLGVKGPCKLEDILRLNRRDRCRAVDTLI
jgi:hypothetical protein